MTNRERRFCLCELRPHWCFGSMWNDPWRLLKKHMETKYYLKKLIFFHTVSFSWTLLQANSCYRQCLSSRVIIWSVAYYVGKYSFGSKSQLSGKRICISRCRSVSKEKSRSFLDLQMREGKPLKNKRIRRHVLLSTLNDMRSANTQWFLFLKASIQSSLLTVRLKCSSRLSVAQVIMNQDSVLNRRWKKAITLLDRK